jgi:pseudouridine synthase
MIRLNKHLAALGIASRREADRLIEQGLISVNGKVVREMGVQVDPEIDKVEVNKKVHEERQKLVYIALHKPRGYTSSVKPTSDDPDTVLDLINIKERIYPVGRLDKETTGLLILTNDGTLTFKLTHPSAECEKEYDVAFYEPISDNAIEHIRSGVWILGQKTLPAKVVRMSPHRVRITIKEGKNRQIRRMCEKVGFTVKGLKRIRIKKLFLGDLPLGEWRYLTPKEVQLLMA